MSTETDIFQSKSPLSKPIFQGSSAPFKNYSVKDSMLFGYTQPPPLVDYFLISYVSISAQS